MTAAEEASLCSSEVRKQLYVLALACVLAAVSEPLDSGGGRGPPAGKTEAATARWEPASRDHRQGGTHQNMPVDRKHEEGCVQQSTLTSQY